MKRFFKCFPYALAGIRLAIKSEQNFRLHLIATCIVIAIGLFVKLSLVSWGLVIFSVGFVLAAELFNAAVERLADEAADGAKKQLIKNAKDLSAAAVLTSALTALVIGILFLLIPLVQRLSEML